MTGRRAGRWMIALALSGVTVSLAVAAAPVTWHLLGYSSVVPPQVDRPAPAVARAPAADIAPILAFAPFGAAPPAEEPVVEAEIRETTMDLVLNGIFFQGEDGPSTAFIGHDGRTQGYRIGDEVAERAVVADIAEDHVLLEIDGAMATLSFPDGDGAALVTADAEGEGEEEEPALTGPERLAAMIVAGEARPAESDTAPQTTEDYIALWRQRIMANPAQVLDAIGLEATGSGYRIAEDHDSGVALAGLQAGDVVTSVNGQPVGDMDRDRQLFDEVAASGLARLEIVRGERTIVLSFPLR